MAFTAKFCMRSHCFHDLTWRIKFWYKRGCKVMHHGVKSSKCSNCWPPNWKHILIRCTKEDLTLLYTLMLTLVCIGVSFSYQLLCVSGTFSNYDQLQKPPKEEVKRHEIWWPRWPFNEPSPSYPLEHLSPAWWLQNVVVDCPTRTTGLPVMPMESCAYWALGMSVAFVDVSPVT